MVTRNELELTKILRVLTTRIEALEQRCLDMERLYVWSQPPKPAVVVEAERKFIEEASE
jgi:hypothetical protein